MRWGGDEGWRQEREREREEDGRRRRSGSPLPGRKRPSAALLLVPAVSRDRHADAVAGCVPDGGMCCAFEARHLSLLSSAAAPPPWSRRLTGPRSSRPWQAPGRRAPPWSSFGSVSRFLGLLLSLHSSHPASDGDTRLAAAASFWVLNPRSRCHASVMHRGLPFSATSSPSLLRTPPSLGPLPQSPVPLSSLRPHPP
jgi:hypothetical protein